MAGLQKAKQYDWKDSNLALFGSDLEKNVKKASAETEVAWKNAGTKVGLEIWRINNFKVEKWPKDDYGKFFQGDSYIIMNTYKKPDEEDLEYDLHFWIGKESSQDEYGTAAYKTVELDTLLNDKPVQHREVQEYESAEFKSYFPTMLYMEGGVKSGFKHVEKKVVKPQLFHFHGDKKHVEIKTVPLNKANLDSSDVYILETDQIIYQWNGKTCNKDEKFKATQYCQDLRSQRNGRPTIEVIDEQTDVVDEFFSHFSDDNDVEDKTRFESENTTKLFRLSDASGSMEFTEVATGEINQGMLDSNDVFVLDKPHVCYVWVGKGASPEEKKGWYVHSHNYLQKSSNPTKTVTQVKEGAEPKDFFN